MPGFSVAGKPGKERAHGEGERRGPHNQRGMQIPPDFETNLSQAGPHQSDQGEKGWKGLEGFDVRDSGLYEEERGIGSPLAANFGLDEIRQEKGAVS